MVYSLGPGERTIDFFVNLIDMGTVWTRSSELTYEGRDHKSGEVKLTGSRLDLVFG
ncbi:MAG: hypothetical protein IPJ06_05665 [Saprospiraceae bacterium]|nr:hypothetical protein [Saprospiraceae bacterium]